MISQEDVQQVAAAVNKIADRVVYRWLVKAVAFGLGLGIAVLLMVPWDRLVGLQF